MYTFTGTCLLRRDGSDTYTMTNLPGGLKLQGLAYLFKLL